MTLTIPANDHGRIRVFELPVPLSDTLRDKDPAALMQAFGVAALDPDYVDIFDLSALENMSLAQFVKHGYDIEPDTADLRALDGVSGGVALIMSRASGGHALSLTLAPGLRHVTTLGDKASLNVAPPLKSDAAEGLIPDPPAKDPPSNAAMSGRIATIALIVLFALVGLMIWVGG